MSDGGAISSGSIVAYLSMNRDQWTKDIDEAKAQVQSLASEKPSVTVTADTTKAKAELDGLRADVTELGSDEARIGVKADTGAATAELAAQKAATDGLARSELDETDVAIANWQARRQNDSEMSSQQSIMQRVKSAWDQMTGSVRDSTSGDSDATKSKRALFSALGDLDSANTKVAYAQRALNDLMKAGAASDDLLAAASTAVASAQEEQATASAAVTAASDAAETAANGLAGALGDINPAQLAAQVGIVAALGAAFEAAGAAVTPLLGAATGLAGALAGMGAAGLLAYEDLKNNAQAVKALDSLKTGLHEIEQTAGSRLLGPLVDSIHELDGALPAVNSEIGAMSGALGAAGGSMIDAFATALKEIQPLLVQGAGYIEQWGAGINSWVQGGGLQEFLNEAQQELPTVVDMLGSFGHAALALFDDLNIVAPTMIKVGDDIAHVVNGATSAADSFNHWVASVLHIKTATDPGSASVQKMAGALSSAQAQALGANNASDTIAGTLQRMGKQASQAGGDITTLQRDLMGLDNGAIAASNANLQLSSAVATFDAGLKTNGHTLDTNTAKGQANMSALNGIASAALTLVAAQAKAGDSTTTVTGTMVSARAEFIKAAEAAGETAAQANHLADQYGLIPKKVSTDFKTTGAAAAESAAHQVAAALGAIPRTVGTTIITTHTDVNGNTASVSFSGKGTAGENSRIAKAAGGWAFAGGGSPWVSGPGSATSDSVDARLSVGEFVVKNSSASYSPSFIEAYNRDPRAALASIAGMSTPQPIVNVSLNGDLQALGAFIDTQISVAQAASARRAGMGQQEIWRA